MLTAIQRARLVRAWREGLPPPWDAVLLPAALAYRGGLALRRAAYACGLFRTRSLPCRVVAIGNLTVGGTGKTPLVELLARALAGRGRRVVVLSRGYGRYRPDAIRAVSDGRRLLLTAAEAGDEPYLLARRLTEVPGGVPVVVGRDRYRAGLWAVPRFQPDVLLLDDGFQHWRLRRDADVVCLDARAPWGRGGLFPQGSLREPPRALRRADLVVLTHGHAAGDLERVRAEVGAWAPAAPVALATYEPDGVEELGTGAVHTLDELRGRTLVAFAGIAVPENFAVTLAEVGVVPRDFVAFPDHHPYAAGDVAALEARARAVGAIALVTTEKDAVRFPTTGTLPVWALRIRLGLRDVDGTWWAALDARLASGGA